MNAESKRSYKKKKDTKQQKIINYYRRGKSAKYTYEKLRDQGYSLSYIYKVRSEYQNKYDLIDRNMTIKRMIKKSLAANETVEQIQEKLGCSQSYIYKIKREFDGVASIAKFSNKTYNIIYADPPWSYKSSSTREGSTDNHYDTLTDKEILDLPVSKLADDNCALLLWVTWPKLDVAMKVIQTWGFEYKTIGFNWIKTYKSGKPVLGLGHYTRGNSEICLLAVKGKMAKVDDNVSSIVMTEKMKHSVKPGVVRDNIVQLFGDLPRIELFARESHSGWDCWGNEAPEVVEEVVEELLGVEKV